MPRPSELARQPLRYLKLAGVTRHDLFTSDATRSQLTWYHGTRSTGLTWCAIRGDEPMKVRYRANPTDSKTTMLCIREAENHAASFGSVFPVLPAEMLGHWSNDRSAERGVIPD